MRVLTRRMNEEEEGRSASPYNRKYQKIFLYYELNEITMILTNQWKYTRLIEQRLETVFNKSGRRTILVTHFTHCATKPHVLRVHTHTQSVRIRNTARKNERQI
ncbi:hypothetical protein WN48_08951 [Eufriesea mexicana]|uniref:Uncharacterized protein n=1 Tax=Eufriesea mexicana TaxID=516756 RepID=A0A310SA85_9HYME|nr:hypothetical protein WN48_08951 [Eufriesea mexicana]